MNATKIFILMLMFFSFFGCNQSKKQFSDDETKLIEEYKLDTELLMELRSYTDSAFRKASGSIDAELGFKDSISYSDFINKKIGGISFNASEDMAFELIQKLRKKFREKGHFIYISEMNSGYSPEEVTILKTDDMFDLIRFEGTNGVNHDIFTEDIIEKLTEWHHAYGLDIVASGFDVVQAYYENTPTDLNKHSEDLYEFCPDIVDQGSGTLEELQLSITRTQQLYLWWD
ncbi:DUF4253 domain-containing protein [Chryseotalea sanaruensis]|uniref:DUF4253 domain-containing protein n=1 Tax=Chryseotalea sanaruensis TaxID=2482724 RepID=A0A401UF93_9BACT|nr:DUF4253 domain-containing protein [Chryseotalea sanaruensis]GCC53520.1 DUF4253 domain-containing protein [Chryseotalea sanaruensis]